MAYDDSAESPYKTTFASQLSKAGRDPRRRVFNGRAMQMCGISLKTLALQLVCVYLSVSPLLLDMSNESFY
jgi:hypothetical protein